MSAIVESPLTLAERAALGRTTAFGQHGYVTDEGEIDREKVVDVLLPPVSQAVASSPKERDRVGLTRDALMGIAFPNVPGRDDWGEMEEPDLAEATWVLLDGDVWRICDQNPSGRLQSRLNGETGLVLVRHEPGRGHASLVYCTRDYACLRQDVIAPAQKKQLKQATQYADLAALLIERVPEHGKKFRDGMIGGLNSALASAKVKVDTALTSAPEQDAE